ncbi:MAG TPA: hypothetical protein VMX94_05805 [Armatimonadota bacterium]|nr:hypothetical protein [Armatimonadota bacterium]
MRAAGIIILIILLGVAAGGVSAGEYRGRYCSGRGDVEYLRLIDRSFDFFHPNPDSPNISMLYYPDWDCLIEGSRWPGWWVQNSYGTTYCAIPFLQEPWLTFLQNSQDMWFKHQGDGQKKCIHTGFIAPEGALCDVAKPTGAIYVQGDCNWKIHDWGFEFTAAGVVMQAELLLISRDRDAIRRYLPNLERACRFIETRRDGKSGLFLAGPASNLLAPSYGGVRLPDGSFGKGYLAGLSVTYLAALDRMVELEKLAGSAGKTALYEARRKKTRESLAQLIAPDGYFVKSLEPDGTKHGVLGQEKYGYFESVVNVDAIAFRAADQAQSERIYAQIASIPGLRPYDFIITNYPSLDDTYEAWGSRDLSGIWEYGRWVNGGAWSTVEARAMLAYYRLGKYEDVRRSNLRSMKLADDFQMDAPLKDFGKTVWFHKRLTNLCYDALGIPAATVRGLFEYVYRADGLTLYPHIPPSIEQYVQKEPIRWGEKRIWLSVKNGGPRIRSLRVNGRKWKPSAPDHVTLPYDALPKDARVELVMEGGWPSDATGRSVPNAFGTPADDALRTVELPEELRKPLHLLRVMQARLRREADADFERAYVAEALRAFDAYRVRASKDAAGAYSQMTPEKRAEISKMYEGAALNLYKGFDGLMRRYAAGDDAREKKLAGMYAGL